MRLARRLIIVSTLAATSACGFALAQDDAAATREQIVAATKQFVEAFNSGDIKKMSELWTEHGDFVGENGQKINFREQLAARAAVKKPANAKEKDLVRPSLTMAVDSVRIVASGVATVDGTSTFKSYPGAPAVHSRFTATWVMREGQKSWSLDSVRENHVPVGLHHAHLAELKWMIGQWSAEDKDANFETVIRWSADGNYLEREFKTRLPGRGEQSGMQRIGWDPKGEQFRSWTFAHDGSFSQAEWTSTENGLEAEVSGVTADGKSIGSLARINKINDDTIEWESVEATLEGQPLPDLKLRLVRKGKKDEG